MQSVYYVYVWWGVNGLTTRSRIYFIHSLYDRGMSANALSYRIHRAASEWFFAEEEAEEAEAAEAEDEEEEDEEDVCLNSR